MLRKVMLAILVAIIVYVVCIVVVALLNAMGIEIASTFAGLIDQLKEFIAIVAGLLNYFGNPFNRASA